MQIDAKCLHYRHVLGLMSEFVIYDDTYDLRKHHRMSDKQLQREQVGRFYSLATHLNRPLRSLYLDKTPIA